MPLNEYKMPYCPKSRAGRTVGQVGQISNAVAREEIEEC